MESGRIFFDPSCHGNMLVLGNGDSIFRGGRSVMNMEETSRRRPFFNTSEELYDEDYYDEQLPEKKRRLTPEQVHSLEKSFEVENKLEPEQKTQLAKKLGLQPRQVAVWFQNRRARWKTKQLEKDFDQLKSSYDSLVSHYESISKENDKLKAEVLSLKDKVKAAEQPAGESPAHHASNPIPTDAPPCLQLTMKLEDRQSIGSDDSAVVDDDGGPQLLDSGDSYFPCSHYLNCAVAAKEDDGSDNGGNYFEYVFPAAEHHYHHHQEEDDGDGEPIGCFIWT